MARSPLLVGSILLHAALGITLFATGVWKLDRLESDTRLANLAVMMPPAAPEGGGASSTAPTPANQPKHKEKQLVKEPVQPPAVKPDEAELAKPTPEVGEPGDGGGQGSAVGPGLGTGSPTSTGSCVGDDCGPLGPPQVAPKPTPKPVVTTPTFVRPTILAALRTSGNTQIHPDANTKTAMLRDGRDRIIGTLQVCLASDGRITSVTVRASTKYPDFDRELVEGARAWRYAPMLVNGVGQPVCGMTTFVYSIR